MKVKYSPVFNDIDNLSYTFGDDILTIELNEVVDTFDFRGLPDGELEIENIETTLEYNVIKEAKRIDGELYLVLRNFIGENASYEERFPDWIDVNG